MRKRIKVFFAVQKVEFHLQKFVKRDLISAYELQSRAAQKGICNKVESGLQILCGDVGKVQKILEGSVVLH